MLSAGARLIWIISSFLQPDIFEGISIETNAHLAPDSPRHGALPRLPFRTEVFIPPASAHSWLPESAPQLKWAAFAKVALLPRGSPRPVTGLWRRRCKGPAPFLHAGTPLKSPLAPELLLGPLRPLLWLHRSPASPSAQSCLLSQGCRSQELFSVNLLHADVSESVSQGTWPETQWKVESPSQGTHWHVGGAGTAFLYSTPISRPWSGYVGPQREGRPNGLYRSALLQPWAYASSFLF